MENGDSTTLCIGIRIPPQCLVSDKNRIPVVDFQFPIRFHNCFPCQFVTRIDGVVALRHKLFRRVAFGRDQIAGKLQFNHGFGIRFPVIFQCKNTFDLLFPVIVAPDPDSFTGCGFCGRRRCFFLLERSFCDFIFRYLSRNRHCLGDSEDVLLSGIDPFDSRLSEEFSPVGNFNRRRGDR